jgi:hypothetical protein
VEGCKIINPEDIDRAARSIARNFEADQVIIVGSQALLVSKPDLDRSLRQSEEIDAYPANYHEWESANPGEEASEAINALFGEGSAFHQTYKFFIDGVDDSTAHLTADWMTRAVRRSIDVDGRSVEVIAPEPNDILAAKLVRGDPKDIQFARRCLQIRLVQYHLVKQRLGEVLQPDMLDTGIQRLRQARGPFWPGDGGIQR